MWKLSSSSRRNGLLAPVTLAILLLSLIGTASAPITVNFPNNKVIIDSNNMWDGVTPPTPSIDERNRQQNEPWITVDPTMPNVLVAGSNDYRMVPVFGDSWAGYYRSEDGGETWTNNLVPGFPSDMSPEGLASPIHGLGAAGDPMMFFDMHSNLYYSGIAFNRGYEWPYPNQGDNENSVWVAKYTDHGTTYSHTVVVSWGTPGLGIFEDKPCMGVDNTGGKYDGNVYVAWTRFPGLGYGGTRIMFSRSTDGGQTFSPPCIISVAGKQGSILNQGSSIAVDPDGTVYVAWRTYYSPSQWQPTPYAMMMAKSTDGGKHFSKPFYIQYFNPVPYYLPGNSFRCPTFAFLGADENGVYLTYQEWAGWPGDGAEIRFTRSTDEGYTWSAPITVNDVHTNHQFWPTISVTGGKIHIAYYSSQNDDDAKLLDVYYAYSDDHGLSFQPSIKVTDVSHDPNYLMFGGGTVPFHGDYIGITSTSDRVNIIWADNRDVIPPVDWTSPPYDFGSRNQGIYTESINL